MLNHKCRLCTRNMPLHSGFDTVPLNGWYMKKCPNCGAVYNLITKKVGTF